MKMRMNNAICHDFPIHFPISQEIPFGPLRAASRPESPSPQGTGGAGCASGSSKRGHQGDEKHHDRVD